MTLAELNVALVISAIVLTAVSGIFLTTQRMWERTSSQGSAYAVSLQAMDGISTALRDACHVYIITRSTPNDTLVVTYPADKTADGYYRPRWISTNLVYWFGSPRHVFYLSTSAGAILATGSVLWRGNLVPAGDTFDTVIGNTIPDPAWSLLPGTGKGRIAPIKAVRFDPPGTGDPPYLYKITVTVTEIRNGRAVDCTVTRRVYARLHE